MGTLLVGAVVAGIVALAARSVYKDRKSGQCAGGCGGCNGCDKAGGR